MTTIRISQNIFCYV